MKGKIVKKFEKILVINGKRHRLTAIAELEDGDRVPRNYIYTFSISGQLDIYAFGAWHCKECGQITDRIIKHFPELRPFMALHLCNYKGQPWGAVENGIYNATHNKDYCMRELRISDEEYEKLLPAAQLNDKLYFKYLLFKLGIVDRWKREADAFIKLLLPEGETWENPYNPIGEERPTLSIGAGDKYYVELKIKDGDYSEENVKKVLAQREASKLEEERQRIIDKYKKTIKEARGERDVMLYILDHGLPVDNVIYYQHNNTVMFNWMDYGNKITQEQFVDFVNALEYSKLPDGILFKFGKN